MNGWIQLHRKLLDNPIFKNHKLLQTFLYCLMKASHQGHECFVGNTLVSLEKGQLVTGRNAISEATGLSSQSVRTALDTLRKMEILTIKSTNKFSVISITNWESHQQTNKQITNKQPTDNQQITTNNNVNNVENEKNDNKSLVVDKFSTDHMEFAKGMYSLILNVAEKAKEPNFSKWADDIRKMNEIDNHDLEEMSQVFKWANNDSFWQTNVMSPSKFREKYATLQAKMKSSRSPSRTVTSGNIELAQQFLSRG